MTGVSFIVTVYNKRPYLPDVLAAVHGQRGDFDREYVIVDNGSTDGSLDLVREVTGGWRNCRVIAQENRGPSGSMNTGVAAATMTYLKLVDADDVLAPDATHVLLRALTESRAVLAIGMGVPYRAGERLEWPAADTEATEPWSLFANPLRRMLRNNTVMNPSTVLLRRADYLRAGGADEAVICQDYSLALALTMLGDFVRVPVVVARTLEAAPGRVSNDQRLILHEITKALGLFIARHPELPRAERAYAVRRAALRAALWARRHGSVAVAARFGVLSLTARLGAVRDPARAILRCCDAFGYHPPARA